MHVSEPPPIHITFYTKPGCHLCEDVADELEALAARYPIHIAAIDITTDLDIHRRYWDKIPVVVVGPRTLSAPITPFQLRTTIAQAVEQH